MFVAFVIMSPLLPLFFALCIIFFSFYVLFLFSLRPFLFVFPLCNFTFFPLSSLVFTPSSTSVLHHTLLLRLKTFPISICSFISLPAIYSLHSHSVPPLPSALLSVTLALSLPLSFLFPFVCPYVSPSHPLTTFSFFSPHTLSNMCFITQYLLTLFPASRSFIPPAHLSRSTCLRYSLQHRLAAPSVSLRSCFMILLPRL